MGLGIDLGASAAKAVEVEPRRGGLRLLGAARRKWTVGPKEASAESDRVRKDLRGLFGTSAHRKAAVALAGKEVLLRITDLPAVADEKLQELVRFELAQTTGMVPSEVSSGHALLGKSQGGGRQVLLAHAKLPPMREKAEVLRACGIRSLRFVPSSVALATAYVALTPAPAGLVALADIGAENCELVLLEGNSLLVARSFSWRVPHGEPSAANGARSRELAEHAVSQLAGAIQASIGFAATHGAIGNLALEKVLLCGGAWRDGDFQQLLSQKLGKPVELFDPFSKVQTGLVLRDLPDGALAQGSPLAVALGLALIEAGVKPIPLSLRIAGRRWRPDLVRRALLALASVLCLGAIGTLWSSQRGALQDARRRLEDLRRETAARSDRQEKVTQLEERHSQLARSLRELGAAAHRGVQFRRLLACLSAGLPEGMTLARVELRGPEAARRVAAGSPASRAGSPGDADADLELSGSVGHDPLMPKATAEKIDELKTHLLEAFPDAEVQTQKLAPREGAQEDEFILVVRKVF